MRLLYASVMDSGTIAGTEQTGYAMINVRHSSLSRKWRSADKIAETLVFDAGAGLTYTFDTIALVAHNFANGGTVRVQVNSTDAWGGLPASQDVVVAWDAGIMIYYFPASINYRFVRIDLLNATSADAYFELGRVMGVMRVTVQGVLQEGIKEDVEDSTVISQSITKQLYADLGVASQIYELPFAHISSATRTQLKTLYATVGNHVPLILVPVEGSEALFPPMYCHLTNTAIFEHAGVTYFGVDALKFAEVF